MARARSSWWDRIQEFIERRVRQRATWAGLLFTFGVAIVGAAAFATGNNLFFLLLGLLLAVLLVSGLANRMNLTSLSVQLIPPPEVFANEPVPVTLQVQNGKWLFDSFALHLQTRRDSGLSARAFFDFLPAGKTAGRPAQLTALRRGRFRSDALLLWSRFPFGFTIRYQIHDLDQDLIVFPQLAPEASLHLFLAALDERLARPRFAPRDDWHHLRPHQPSDSWRRIDWKASARLPELQAREYHATGVPEARIRLDLRASNPDAFERAVSAAATALVRILRAGGRVTFESQHQTFEISSAQGLYTGLKYLAEVEPDLQAPAFPHHEDFPLDLELAATDTVHWRFHRGPDSVDSDSGPR